MSDLYIIQRYCAKNDNRRQARRVYVIRDQYGRVIHTAPEGQLSLSSWLERGHVVDIGDVDVSPGIVRRMVGYRIEGTN